MTVIDEIAPQVTPEPEDKPKKKRKARKKKTGNTRTMFSDIYFPDINDCQELDNVLKQYRHVLNKTVGNLALASMAGARLEFREPPKPKKEDEKEEVEKIMSLAADLPRPELVTDRLCIFGDSEAVRKALTLVFGHEVSKDALPGYQMRDWIIEQMGLRGDFADAVFRDIMAVWRAKDAQFANITKEYGILNGFRAVPQFKHVWLPIRSRLIKIAEPPEPEPGKNPQTSRELHIKMRADGPLVKVKLKKLDPHRWSVWRNIVEGRYQLGTCRYMKVTRRGTPCSRLAISYTMPMTDEDVAQMRLTLNADKEMVVTFGDDTANFLMMKVLHGQKTVIERIKHRETHVGIALDYVIRNQKQQNRLREDRRGGGSCNRRRRGFGNPGAVESINRRTGNLSYSLDKTKQVYNHTWAKLMVEQALREHCGRLVISPHPEKFFSHAWSWAHLRFCIKYKAKEVGIIPVFRGWGDKDEGEENLNKLSSI